MTILTLRFRAPLRGYQAINVHIERGATADEVARKAIFRVALVYGFGMDKMPHYDGLECIGASDGFRTVGWGGLLKGGRKLRVAS